MAKSSFYRKSSSPLNILESKGSRELSPMLILLYDVDQLARCAKLSPEDAQELQEKTAKSILKTKFITADQIPEWSRLSTGCYQIDSVLRGGVPFNGITEVYGSSGVGKTQLMLQLCLRIQLPPSYGGHERGALYISTEDVFPSKRYHQLTEWYKKKYNLPYKDFESNTFLDHPHNLEQFKRCLFVKLPKLIQAKNIGLIVIDSIAGVFRSENLITNFVQRGQDIVEIANHLNTLGNQHKLVVICANQVTQNIKTNTEEPCLGLTWSNNVTYRLQISRPDHSSPCRNFKIITAPDLPTNQCVFTVTQNGIEDTR